MAEYIDREKLLHSLKTAGAISGWGEHIINNFPPADVAPVKHGKWELCFEDSRRQIEGNKCSVCGYEYYGNKYFYCPNCGARMDGDT